MEIPESRLIRHEYTIRNMELPGDIKMTKKSLIRWFALAFGLISPNESRKTILDLLETLFYFQFSEKIDPDVRTIMKYLEKKGIKINEKTLRYHLFNLKQRGLIERRKGRYHMDSSLPSENYIHKTMPALSKIDDVVKTLRRMYGR